MEDRRSRSGHLLAIAALAASAMWMVTSWGFARFVHYHSQTRVLSPADYQVQVVSARDYERLCDVTTKTVRLEDGTQVVKGEKWDSVVLPNYQAVDGAKRYILVSLRGTAPLLPLLESAIMPSFLLLIVGLLITVASLPRSGGQKEQRAA